ncbi:CubicO group peptidase, beta-lactamase class C family [Pedobacter insulae]|uniref:CubicO group peptidase, beta-lactamase class C family n=2 Tax=Pedobacter insulae TaxID=414048 RepID=A0A1I2ZDT0_9SPHI|nr:CubicO group peptidase, beta-lactamase class C family [Pedobacter insulae]
MLVLSLVFSACVPLTATRYLMPDSKDSARFNNVTIEKSITPFHFGTNYPNQQFAALKQRLDTALRATKTNVFLIIKNDSIIYQHLSEGTDLADKQPSFSMVKSFVGTLVGIAVDRDQIASTNDLVIKYLPDLAKNDERFKRLTIQHVLDMKSGFDINERAFNPFSRIVRMYYGADLKRMVRNLKMKHEPNTVFEYQSINTQVLAMILEKATGKKLQVLLQEDLWKPLGTESEALWSLDNENNVKAFCCMYATALDFAKFGRLYLNGGNWQGKQIISKKWIDLTTHPDTLTKNRYKNQMWSGRNYRYVENPTDKQLVYDYKAQGMFNQSIYVNPQNKVIIVRLGGRQKQVNFHSFVREIGRSIKP